jgi:hypothetical protein
MTPVGASLARDADTTVRHETAVLHHCVDQRLTMI